MFYKFFSTGTDEVINKLRFLVLAFSIGYRVITFALDTSSDPYPAHQQWFLPPITQRQFVDAHLVQHRLI